MLFAVSRNSFRYAIPTSFFREFKKKILLIEKLSRQTGAIGRVQSGVLHTIGNHNRFGEEQSLF